MFLALLASIPAVSQDREMCSLYLDTAYELGITGVEIKLGNHDLIGQDMKKWLKEALEVYDFDIYTHLPYLQGDVNLASSNERLADEASSILLESIDYSADLGASLVNTHLGAGRGDGGFIKRAVDRLKEIIPLAECRDVEISIENQESGCDGILNSPQDIKRVLTLEKDLSLTFDAGHAKTHGFGVHEFLPSVLPRLRYLHLHDNNGGRDQHLSLGNGSIDFQYLFHQLNEFKADLVETMPATLELTYQDLGPSLRYLEGIERGTIEFA